MKENTTPWIIDRFDDTKILRYKVPAFENLSLEEKKMIYYLSQAAKWGRDILFDQNFKFNIIIRRTLEALYRNYSGERNCEMWCGVVKYLKHVWFANGIHHHYSNDKFTPEFSQDFFEQAIHSLPAELLPADFGGVDKLLEVISPVIFDSELYSSKINRADGADVVQDSATNFYSNLS
ncbi:MAG: dihydrofolate reductase, partial [Rikenellaceae bacterium]